MKITTYSIRFDERTKELLLLALGNFHSQLEQQLAREPSDQALETYDQVGQVRRGILMSPGEETETEQLEEENSETIDE